MFVPVIFWITFLSQECHLCCSPRNRYKPYRSLFSSALSPLLMGENFQAIVSGAATLSHGLSLSLLQLYISSYHHKPATYHVSYKCLSPFPRIIGSNRAKMLLPVTSSLFEYSRYSTISAFLIEQYIAHCFLRHSHMLICHMFYI